MAPEVLHLAKALHAGATPLHIAALKNVRDSGAMWPVIDTRKVADREEIKRALWGWRAVERVRAGVKLTEIGRAILYVNQVGAWHDARSNQCTR